MSRSSPDYESRSGTPEALVSGTGAIEGSPLVVAVNNFAFKAAAWAWR